MVVRLRTQDLKLGYGGCPVISGVSLELEAGELVAVIGENGAGKSTLLRGLAGLMTPMHGVVFLEDQDLASVGVRQRARKIAVLPQMLRHLSGMSVNAFVIQGRYVHRPDWQTLNDEDEQAVARAIQAAELTDLKDRPLEQLSGGERQRAVFARALAQDTELLLVDEPTAALDARHQLWVFRRLSELVCRGRTVVVVTHDLNLASQFADRIVLLGDGGVLGSGAPRDVLRPELLRPLLGDEHLHGEADAGRPGRARPWFIPWWHGADPAPEEQHPEGPNPDAG